MNEVTLKVRWEPLKKLKNKGPVGEYIAVEDQDAKGRAYDPVDLNDPRLARAGWLGAIGGQPSVSPTNGLRRKHEDHRAL